MRSTAERIARLPRRPPLGLAEHWALSHWAGVDLRPSQAEALRELQAAKGLFAQLGVGEGKTLITMLAPQLLLAQRPVLVIPGSLRDEVEAEHALYRANGWRVGPTPPRIVSYTDLGQRYNDKLLKDLDPDLLMLDEAWHARNIDAACTRKLDRWITANPQCVVAVLAGTLITANLLDFQHLAHWALKDRAPVPLQRSEAERWAETVTDAYFEHFRNTRGVVTTPGSSCQASIEIGWWKPNLPEVLRRAIEDVESTGCRPDGVPLDEDDTVDCLSQLALGFYYRWDPPAPEDWLQARRAWWAYVRAILDERLEGFDSPKQIEDALDQTPRVVFEPIYDEDDDAYEDERAVIGHRKVVYPPPDPPPHADTGRDLFHAWRAIAPTFVPNRVPVWLTDDVLRQVVEHTKGKDPTLIWTRYAAVGRRLSTHFCVDYYGAGGSPAGAAGLTIALSIDAHGTGRNLQAWRRNLVLTPMANARGWEQLVGRTHRQGQRADLVEVEIIDAIDYHRSVMSRVRYEARKDGKAADLEQKLIRATWRKR